MQISQSMRQLTYLQLCVLPTFIEPFLARLTPSQLKVTNFLFMQTFFQHNSDISAINGFGQPSSMLKEYSKRPIGQQMIYLLKKTLAFYIANDYPLHTFFLQFDQKTQPLTINLQRALLNQIMTDGSNEDIISIIIIALDLALQLCQIKRGNAKFIFNLGNKNESQDLQMQSQAFRRNKCLRLTAKVQQLKERNNLSLNIQDFCSYCLNLAAKYEFVVLTSSQKQNKKDIEKCQLLIAQQIEEGNANLELPIQSDQYWLLPSSSDSCELINRKYISLITNLQSETINTIHKLKNSALILINKLTEAREQFEVQMRMSMYSLVVDLKILTGLKQKCSSQQKIAQECQNYYKQIMQLQTCKIDTTFYFLIAYLQLDIEKQTIYNQAVNLIGWVMSQYRKYSFKNKELIYADFIASTLDLLLSWKSSQKSDEEQKQVENVLLKLASKTKSHGQGNFALFFQTLNTKLLKYVSACLTKAQSFQIPKSNQNNNLSISILTNFQTGLNKYLKEFTCRRLKQRSNDLQQAQEALLYVYFIIEQKCQLRQQELLCIKLYHLIKAMLWKNKSKENENFIQIVAKKCLRQCLQYFFLCLNQVLLQYSISSSKKNQNNSLVINVNSQSRRANIFIAESIKVLIFLNLLLFGINKKQNKMCFLYALVFDSHSQEQNFTQSIGQIYQEVLIDEKIGWSEEQIQLLKHSKRYDTLEIFYEVVLKKEGVQKKKHFQKFCRNWCLQQTNYQWLSDPKANRIGLVELKQLCLKIRSDFKS